MLLNDTIQLLKNIKKDTFDLVDDILIIIIEYKIYNEPYIKLI